MTIGMFCLPSSQSNPFLIHDLSPSFNKSKTTGATCGEGSAYPPGVPNSSPVLVGFVLFDI
jgi:hypothetical protein